MRQAKRTQKEIEKDCRRLKEAAKTATTIKELQDMTGLSYYMINVTLSKHPIIFKRIKEQLAINKERADLEAQNSQKLEKEKEETCIGTESNKIEGVAAEKGKNFSGFVIDASITGLEDLKKNLSRIYTANETIILTSITIKELEKMQHFNDVQGVDARYILALAAENDINFKTVLIDETLDTPDDCIIKYCADNKEQVSLLTSDKTMALKARMYGVQVKYLKQAHECDTSKSISVSNSKVRTLIPAKRIGNKLLLSISQEDTMSIRVYSNGLEYNDGIQELKIGDDVFIATKKPGYVTFAHYRIISLFAENNCEIISSKRIYDMDDINDMSKDSYKSFLKNFKNSHNL